MRERTTDLTAVGKFALGWLGRYVDGVGRNRIPNSFHLLSGMLTLGAVVGRKARIARSTYEMWPAVSILLLGSSGVGKSQSLGLARRVMKAATKTQLGMEPRLGWFDGTGAFTSRGMMQQWAEIQKSEGTEWIEGMHVEGEIANIVTQRKGNELISTWLIQALEHQDMVDYTGLYGKMEVKGLTVGFGLGSTVEYLRRALSPDEFAGGFMHRFLIAYELNPDRTHEERTVDSSVIERLAQELREIREWAPADIAVTDAATRRLSLLHKQEKFYSNHRLAGFWNRYDSLTLRIAQVLVIAQMKDTVGVEELELADELLRNHLYPPLEWILEQVSANWQKKELLDVADSLRSAGPKGWTMQQLLRKLGKGANGSMDAIVAMEEQGLLHRNGSRVFRFKAWSNPEEDPE